MSDPTDGCPECGTVDTTHADDCEYLQRQVDGDPSDAPEDQSETAHPYPHRAWCRHCQKSIEKASAGAPWLAAVPNGRHAECWNAPLIDGDLPGHHEPVKVLSANGPVPDGVR